MKLKFPFRTDSIQDSENIDLDIYSPQRQNLTHATSLDVINGCLDSENIDFPAESSTLPLSCFRSGSLFRGRMVSTTINSDYGKKLFDWESGDRDIWAGMPDSDSELIQPIPGAGIELYAPCSGLLLLTWQISYTSDLDTVDKDRIDNSKPEWDSTEPTKEPPPPESTAETTAVHSQRAFITLMGAKGQTNFELDELGYRHYLPHAVTYLPIEGTKFARQMGAGRIWSGHHMVNVSKADWYRYGLGIMSTANLSRVRIRNFKYLFFPNATAKISGTDPDESGLW